MSIYIYAPFNLCCAQWKVIGYSSYVRCYYLLSCFFILFVLLLSLSGVHPQQIWEKYHFTTMAISCLYNAFEFGLIVHSHTSTPKINVSFFFYCFNFIKLAVTMYVIKVQCVFFFLKCAFQSSVVRLFFGI